MECEKCSKPIIPEIYNPGCTKCIRHNAPAKDCEPCIKASTAKNYYPNFKAR